MRSLHDLGSGHAGGYQYDRRDVIQAIRAYHQYEPLGKALEIQSITHPNGIIAGSDASFALLFDGKPLANADITLFRSAGVYDGRKVVVQVKSGMDGRFSLKPEDAGTYLILVRHRAAAPAGSETPYRSYTYTLTFDAA